MTLKNCGIFKYKYDYNSFWGRVTSVQTVINALFTSTTSNEKILHH